MTEGFKTQIRMHVRGVLITLAVWIVLIFGLGATVLQHASEATTSAAGLGIAVFGLLVGYGTALYWLAREVR